MSSEQTESRPAQTLWVMSEVYYPEDISTGYYLTAIAEGLTQDHSVKVITGQPKHMNRGVRALRNEERNGVEIHRVWGTTFDKNFLPLRLINMLTIGFSTFLFAVRSFKHGDKAFAVTAPPTMPLVTTLAALIKGASVTILIQDSYPEILVAVGKIGPNSLTGWLTNFANRWVYKYASKIIVIGRDMKELFEKKTEGLDVPIEVIPNWADLESIHPEPRKDNVLLKELGILDKFVLLCAGNLGPAIDLETLIGAARLLRSNENVHFLFIGAGAKVKWLRSQIEEHSLSNVTQLDYRPREEQNIFLNACDVGLVALVQGMKGTAMPSRTYNLMAGGKPVIAVCESGSELDLVVREDEIGTVVEPGDAQELAHTIEEMLNSDKALERYGHNAREAAVKKYSRAVAIDAFRNAMR